MPKTDHIGPRRAAGGPGSGTVEALTPRDSPRERPRTAHSMAAVGRDGRARGSRRSAICRHFLTIADGSPICCLFLSNHPISSGFLGFGGKYADWTPPLNTIGDGWRAGHPLAGRGAASNCRELPSPPAPLPQAGEGRISPPHASQKRARGAMPSPPAPLPKWARGAMPLTRSTVSRRQGGGRRGKHATEPKNFSWRNSLGTDIL